MSPELLHLIEIVGAILSVVAMILAIITEGKVKRIYRSAERIAESVSTKYVGKFPENMEDIIKLISSTRRYLTIVCDVPSYGHFSNPQGFVQYSQAIRNLLIPRIKPKISIITYSHEKRLENSANQFNKTYNEIINSDTYNNYFEYHKGSENIKPPKEKTKEAFCNWLEEKHCNFILDLYNTGVHVYESSVPLRAFVWISDDSAIFSFYNYGTDVREVSFRTNDQTLIGILGEIAESTIQSSVKYLPHKLNTEK